MPDLLTLPSSTSDVSATGLRTAGHNLGDRWLDTTTMSSVWDAAKGMLMATSGTWSRTTDVVDLTGDGAADLVSWSGRFATAATDDLGGTPLRLLETIDNGRGGRVRLAYATSTTPEVVDLTGGILPSPRWVVRTITVEAGAGQPASETRYRYAAPVTGRSSPADADPHFLGFGRVEVETPRPDGTGVGARVVRSFNYAIGADTSGRLVREQTFVDGAATATHDRQLTWRNVALLGVTFTYRAQELAYTCAPGQAAPACALLRTTDTWSPHMLANGKIALYLHTRTAQGPGVNLANFDRATYHEYEVRTGQSPSQPNDYRVLETRRERQRGYAFADGIGFMAIGRTNTMYDAVGLPYRTETWLTVAAGVVAVTQRTFDPQTGNLLTTRRPNQVATGGPVTTLTYDSHRLFVVRTVNERGHVVFTTNDPATGALLRREGPNQRSMKVAGCRPTPTQTCLVLLYAPETWRIDGFGRAIEHRVTAEPVTAGNGYALQLAERTTYAETELPNRRWLERRRDADGTVWVTADDRFDGRGRLVSHTEANAVTSYRYDALGQLAAVRVPDPRIDFSAQVEHRYQRDGLGRVTRFTRADGSVTRVNYAGLDVTTTERSSAETTSEVGARTTAHFDVFGQIASVDEHDNPLEGQVATTRYSYDPAGRVASIVDADGITTTMSHDWADRRTAITRGARVWRYEYDPEGNVLTEVSPLPPAHGERRRLPVRDPLRRARTPGAAHPGAPRPVGAAPQPARHRRHHVQLRHRHQRRRSARQREPGLRQRGLSLRRARPPGARGAHLLGRVPGAGQRHPVGRAQLQPARACRPG